MLKAFADFSIEQSFSSNMIPITLKLLDSQLVVVFCMG